MATDGEQGLDSYNKGEYDLCIFDVMMPKKDGFTLAGEIREKDTEMPIIFLTARAIKDDVLKGFKLGADDYITKPFNSEELALSYSGHPEEKPTESRPSRRDQGVSPSVATTSTSPCVSLPLIQVTEGEAKEKLSPKEAQLLRMFAMYMNDILPRSEALNKIWGEDTYFTARSMDVFVTKLRKYLKQDENIEIVNIHGNGFQLLVRAEEEA